MPKTHQSDGVDAIREQWRRERPDLDTGPMATIGRLGRCSQELHRYLNEVFTRFGLTSWEFDVLATLRRSGSPYRLAPTEIFSSLMLSSGTMTRQLHILAERGFISRSPNPKDARSMLVQLTPQGLALIDEAVTAHVANMARLFSRLEAKDIAALDRSLRELLATLESRDARAQTSS